MSTADRIALATAIATSGAVLVSVVGLVFVYRQLGRMAEANERMAEANRLANAMAVVQLEEAVRSARAELVEVSHRIVSSDSTPGYDVEPDRLVMEEKTERYLNVMDRLCSYIRRGHIDERTYRKDYRAWIAETIQQHADKFGAATRHGNILHVHRAWSEDRPARDA